MIGRGKEQPQEGEDPEDHYLRDKGVPAIRNRLHQVEALIRYGTRRHDLSKWLRERSTLSRLLPPEDEPPKDDVRRWRKPKP